MVVVVVVVKADRTRCIGRDTPQPNVRHTCMRTREQVNKEDHLQPILCHEVDKALGVVGDAEGVAAGSKAEVEGKAEEGSVEKGPMDDAWVEAQEPELLKLLAHELDCDVKNIVDFELSLYGESGVGGNIIHHLAKPTSFTTLPN